MNSVLIQTDIRSAQFSTVKATFRDIQFEPFRIHFECTQRQAIDLVLKIAMNPIIECIKFLDITVKNPRLAFVTIESDNRFEIKNDILGVHNG